MSSFTSPLQVSPTDDGRHWTVLAEFDYHVGEHPSATVIHVPAGFVTDFATTPRIFWAVFPPWDRYGKAAIVHDYAITAQLFPRKQCDAIFLEAMTVLGVATWRRYTIYGAVRTFTAIKPLLDRLRGKTHSALT